MIHIHAIDTHNKLEREAFYAVGKSIRTVQTSTDIIWQDDYSLDEFLSQTEIEIKLWIAKSPDGEGRIAAIHHPEDEHGFIGWYECDNDDVLSETLLEKATEFLSSLSITQVIGPVNGNTWNTYRFNLTANFPLVPGEPYQPLYYVNQWKKFGFKPHTYYQSDIAPSDLFEPMTWEEGQELAQQFNLKVIHYPTEPDEVFLKKMHHFYSVCFSENPLFTPIDFETYRKAAEKAAHVVEKKHCILVMDQEENPIAVTLCYKDIFHEQFLAGTLMDDRHNQKRLFIKTLATHPEWRNKQIGTLMINLIHNMASVNGYQTIYHMLMYQQNLSATKGKEKFVTTKMREYGLYTLSL